VLTLLPGWADEASALPHPAPLTESIEMAVSKALGVSIASKSAIPGACARWQHANPDRELPENLVCADPVHLLAGSDDAQLIPYQRLNLPPEESSALLLEVNKVLSENSFSFLHDVDGQWYHRGLNAKALDTDAPTAIEGHPMTDALPRSDEARPWRSLMTETQMVLHQSEVNQARIARGAIPINSVWFWGGGEMPGVSTLPDPSAVAVYTDDAFTRGLATAVGAGGFALSEFDSLALSDSVYQDHLVLDTRLFDGHPDFVDQKELGEHWCSLLRDKIAGVPKASAEINGLTGCREVILPAIDAPRSVLSRLARLWR